MYDKMYDKMYFISFKKRKNLDILPISVLCNLRYISSYYQYNLIQASLMLLLDTQHIVALDHLLRIYTVVTSVREEHISRSGDPRLKDRKRPYSDRKYV